MKRFSAIIVFTFALFLNAQEGLPGFNSGYIEADKGKLYYESAGEGETIVLIHDGSLHNVVWDEQFRAFAGDHKVVRYDRRGYGKSSIPTGRYSNIQDLNQLFTQLKIQKAILFGMSAGGGLAIDFSLKYPEKVSGLVLVGAVVSGFGYTLHMATRGGRFDFRSPAAMETKNFIKYFGWDDPYTIYSRNVKAKEKLLSYLEANPQNIESQRLGFESGAEKPAVKSLGQIKVPTLVLTGEFDIPDVQAHAGAITAGIPNAIRDIMPNSGHLIPLELPEEFNKKTMRFVKNTEFFNILNSAGTKAAADYINRNMPASPSDLFIGENAINERGYEYLMQDKFDDAITLFTINTVLFPGSANAFDSLGEAYMKAGKKALAIKNYEKSLELDPHNTNAAEQLKKLK